MTFRRPSQDNRPCSRCGCCCCVQLANLSISHTRNGSSPSFPSPPLAGNADCQNLVKTEEKPCPIVIVHCCFLHTLYLQGIRVDSLQHSIYSSPCSFFILLHLSIGYAWGCTVQSPLSPQRKSSHNRQRHGVSLGCSCSLGSLLQFFCRVCVI